MYCVESRSNNTKYLIGSGEQFVFLLLSDGAAALTLHELLARFVLVTRLEFGVLLEFVDLVLATCHVALRVGICAICMIECDFKLVDVLLELLLDTLQFGLGTRLAFELRLHGVD